MIILGIKKKTGFRFLPIVLVIFQDDHATPIAAIKLKKLKAS